MAKRECPFTSGKIPVEFIDYKNVRFLKKFLSEAFKIVPRRITCVKNVYQHKLAREVKYARYLALVDYILR